MRKQVGAFVLYEICIVSPGLLMGICWEKTIKLGAGHGTSPNLRRQCQFFTCNRNQACKITCWIFLTVGCLIVLIVTLPCDLPNTYMPIFPFCFRPLSHLQTLKHYLVIFFGFYHVRKNYIFLIEFLMWIN